ncbi:SprT-like domain-containing protein [Ruminococcaceae bacterium OttesenSCG-928-O06]|nr:SprT-like domain-containing protein [Ruminococcaceae bacterium OttesenSCG-928-O06]
MLSEVQQFLERAFGVLNNHYFQGQLPPVVITIQSSPRTYGHISVQKVWKSQEAHYHEINISAENLSRPAENVLATLMHEMVHLYCMVEGIQDTSKNGRYHNKEFRLQAMLRGLDIQYVRYVGYSKTAPTDVFIATLKQYELIREFNQCRVADMPVPIDGGQGQGKQGTRAKKGGAWKYMCPTGCGTRVRAAKEVNALCGECGKRMVEYGSS